ncbi:hypothetical protein I0C86_20645 [Plantactinospora sp. S1510]|uniref:Uncharacterized protein n=1 Tax=Plantactinospora alkalitolerans TaxID=2789879 RepID=A0ABS0GYR0_9ACTN|nr:hypothetical protein [Plantactinospora alkalitolerans]MBF9131353.1 hypothetical protein [Plantactinospora alkalitolerans]
MKGIVTILGVAVLSAIIAGLVELGLPTFYALTIACFLTGLLSILIGRALDDAFSGPNIIVVFGWMMFFGAPFALATAWGESGFRPHGLLRWLLAASIEALLLVAILMAVAQVQNRRARGRREHERRSLATAHDWQFAETDATLLPEFGPTLRLVMAAWFGSSEWTERPVAPDVATHAVLRGQIDGVPFLVFDYYRPRRFGPPDIETVLVVPLPYRVPLFASADVHRLRGDEESVARITDPALARLVATPEVAMLTEQRLPCWGFQETALVALSNSRSSGAAGEKLSTDIAIVVRIATLLDWAEISRYQPLSPTA